MDVLHEVIPPLLEWVPEITPPSRSKPMDIDERMRWTAAILVVYLMMSQVPIFGSFGQASDPFYQQRLILGSSRGSIMELGISPLLTSGLITSFMSSSNFLTSEKEEKLSENEKRKKNVKIQKLLGFFLCLCQSVLYVLSGMYGKLDVLGNGNATIIVLQLFLSGSAVILFDEILSLEYGVTRSGISLFIATNICADVIWKAFSPVTIFTSQRGIASDFIGIFPCLVKSIYLSVRHPNRTLQLAYMTIVDRGTGMSTISGFLGTTIIILVYSYFRNVKFDLSLHKKTIKPGGGGIVTYSIPLLYTGTMPIILYLSFIQNIFIVSQNMSNKYKKVALVKLLGVWKPIAENSDIKIPISGLSYYISPPTSTYNALIKDPVHTLVYTVFVVVACVLFSQMWVEVSQSGSKVVAQQLRNQNLVIKGFREKEGNGALDKVLDRLIPTATIIGAVVLGLIFVLSELLNAVGTGSGLLLAVATISECLAVITKEGGLAFLS